MSDARVENRVSVDALASFLHQVDKLFPVPLSAKQNLDDFARKLCEKATLCVAHDGEVIVALVAGYTDHVVDNMGYISIAATLPQVQGRGYSSSLIREFLDIAREKQLQAVHLYAVRENAPAMHMYRKLGFVDYYVKDEPRPKDAHLILYLEKEGEE